MSQNESRSGTLIEHPEGYKYFKISDEDWRKKASTSLARICGEKTAQDAIAEWSDFSGQVDHEYLAFLESSFNGVDVAVLTNGTSRLNSDLAKLNLLERFFTIFNSAEIGVCKPDPKVFKHVVKQLGCEPQEILFVDDSLSHVNAAIELGMAGYHYGSLKGFQEKFV